MAESLIGMLWNLQKQWADPSPQRVREKQSHKPAAVEHPKAGAQRVADSLILGEGAVSSHEVRGVKSAFRRSHANSVRKQSKWTGR